ncbi:MAG: hypothetical protein II953_09590 [Clostridia bacterium]|nr:hypothetical protein [Clostridia bacterium]
MDSTVKTADGVGTVTEISPLTGFIKVRIREDVKPYHRDDVTLLKLKSDKKPARSD